MKKMLFVLIAFLASPAFAEAPKITTGDSQFTYYQTFGPNLAKVIASTDRTFNGTMFPEVISSTGSGDNLSKVASGEAQIGFTQPDAYMGFRAEHPNEANQIIVLGQLPRYECVFAVAKASGDSKVTSLNDLNESTTVDIGDIGSGSSYSWEYFQRLIPDLKRTNIPTNQTQNILAVGEVQTEQAALMLFVSAKDADNEIRVAVNSEGSDLKFIDLDSDKFEAKLPNGKPVYEVMSVKVNDDFTGNSVDVPCMKPLVIVSRKNDPKLNTAVARAVLKNSAAIVKIN